MTCCNFLISQIYASFHLEPLVYKEMDTKIKIITDFYGQPKNPLYDLTSFILQEFFNSDGNPVQLILYDSNLNSPAAMAIKWASYCSNCEDKKKKKKNRCLRHLKCITSDRHIENVCASYTFQSSWLSVIKYALGAWSIIHCVSSARCHAVGVYKKPFLLSCLYFLSFCAFLWAEIKFFLFLFVCDYAIGFHTSQIKEIKNGLPDCSKQSSTL